MASPIASLLVEVGADIGKFTAGLGVVESQIGGLVGNVAKLGVGLAVGLGGAAVAGMAVATKSAGNLEEAVANISTVKPDIDTSAVFASLNQMSTEIPQTAVQLGDALYNIFSSIDVDQFGGLKLAETFAKGATAARTDANTFGTAILGVMNAYNLSVSDAAHISDVFFNTVRDGVVNGQELAGSLGLVTATARAASVDLDTLGGLIVGVTKQGGPAAQNINNLANFLAKVNSKEAIKGFSALGVQTTDANGNFRDMVSILGDSKTALDKLAPAAQNAAIQNIFQDFQARTGFQTLLNQLGFVNQAIASNRHESGSAEAAYQKMASTFNTQSKLLVNTLAAIGIEIGGNLLPILTPLLQAFRLELPRVFETARAVVATFTTDAGALGIVLANIRTWFGDAVANGIEPFFQGFMTGGWAGLAQVVGTKLLDGLGALWTTATAFLGEQWAQIDWNAVLTNLGNLGSAVGTKIGELWGQIDWTAVLNTVSGAAGGIAGAVGTWLKQKWDEINWADVGAGLGTGIRTLFTTVLDGLASAPEAIASLNTNLTTLFNGADYAGMGTTAGTHAGEFINSFADALLDPAAWAPVLNRFYTLGTTFGPSLLQGLGDGILNMARGPLGGLLSTALGVPGASPTVSIPLVPPIPGLPGGPPSITINVGEIKDKADADHLIDRLVDLLSQAANRASAPFAQVGGAP